MEQIKLEVGKTYLNRIGSKIKIVSADNSKAPLKYIGDDNDRYSLNGSWSYSRTKSQFDLVREVTP